jgi:hypothetical protein
VNQATPVRFSQAHAHVGANLCALLNGRFVPMPMEAFLPGGDDLEQQLGDAGGDLDVAEFIGLCRARHKWMSSGR